MGLCWVESKESAAEDAYFDMLQKDGRLKCGCGKLFDAEDEGGTVSPDPWAMPVCGDCFDEWYKSMQKT